MFVASSISAVWTLPMSVLFSTWSVPPAAWPSRPENATPQREVASTMLLVTLVVTSLSTRMPPTMLDSIARLASDGTAGSDEVTTRLGSRGNSRKAFDENPQPGNQRTMTHGEALYPVGDCERTFNEQAIEKTVRRDFSPMPQRPAP